MASGAPKPPRGGEMARWSGGFTEAEMQAAAFRRRMKAGGNDVETLKSEKKKKKKEKKAKKAKKNHRHEGKDEFGRDILPGTTPPSRSPSESSRSSSPPPDPVRPDLDEQRHNIKHTPRPPSSRSRSRDRSRSRERSRGRSRERTASRRNRSRERNATRSRSRSRGRRSDVAKKPWTHDAFFNRSPSPIRQIDPFYKPNPESWVSRAGGVYLPKQ
ncbi:hypothetical protein H310_01325 [Aphanomyces invadans]|uniref:Uncharacterized protein n=1 Tax=Aphanomyces invadans TaxID=157072 RepID=A0A024UT38_9STRA|nr:hypothetical protein H310_01325 [Aphanomyces invadans]ETW08818.1 hypothetical protein H310_01325 [Aphanomyces invadans]|eukprot:XP_008862623.1 hypothetical protein H310_01325 [Aphanomyces invadans]